MVTIYDKQTVRLFPLGGIGNVTKNLFVYEYRVDGKLVDMLIVDCGIGFPDESMYGVDLVIPDITYLLGKRDKIRGLILTHGHDDHIGALPYLLPELKVPLYATTLTAAFAESKLKESNITNKITIVPPVLTLGAFTIEAVHVTHSIPDAVNYVIKTPIGTFYHGSDFKFDFTPLDDKPTEVGKIAQAGEQGILCLLTDSLGSERAGYTLSERVIEDTLEDQMRDCRGKFIFTTVSSNILRIQKTIEVALRHNRKVAFIGRSIAKNIEIAQKLGYITFSQDAIVYDKQLERIPARNLCLIVAGSQGQTESALARIGSGEHTFVKIKEGDVVIFSADPIPGNENAVHALIDSLTRLGARVAYSDVTEDIHVSGHGSQQDLRLMLSLTKPRYILPIGGTYRHMIQYKKLAQEMGYGRDSVLIPEEGDVLEFSPVNPPRVAETVRTEQVMVDGLGIGDVGEIVLRDRQTLASEGIVVIVVPVEESSGRATNDPDIISRGFIYMKESGKLVGQTKQVVVNALKFRKGRILDWHFMRRDIEKQVAKFLFKHTGRKPLVVVVLLEV